MPEKDLCRQDGAKPLSYTIIHEREKKARGSRDFPRKKVCLCLFSLFCVVLLYEIRVLTEKTGEVSPPVETKKEKKTRFRLDLSGENCYNGKRSKKTGEKQHETISAARYGTVL